MRVYYTVDTEFWPANYSAPDWSMVEQDFARDVLGQTKTGEFGIGYQMDLLESEGLKGVFFIEALHALHLGSDYLRRMVGEVSARGHEAALHIHTEWLKWVNDRPIGGRTGRDLKDFSGADQEWIVENAVRLLRDSGVANVASFRAGNYGANRNTLRALARAGVAFDSSYNFIYLGTQCGIDSPYPMIRPEPMEGLIEVPITFIEDYPGHHRHMQIMAASFEEMRAALDQAHQRQSPSFVFVSHGFELIRRNRVEKGAAQADGVVRRRFERLVRYLGRNKDRFHVSTFTETSPSEFSNGSGLSSPIKGSPLRMFMRQGEQLIRRLPI